MITITETAGHRISEMMKEEDIKDPYLRVGVKGGGCSGLSYGMGFDNEVNEGDETFELQGFKIVIDADSAPIIKGTVIDYKQNMMGGGFTIDNPNAIGTCGCGSSFKTATNEGTPENC